RDDERESEYRRQYRADRLGAVERGGDVWDDDDRGSVEVEDRLQHERETGGLRELGGGDGSREELSAAVYLHVLRCEQSADDGAAGAVDLCEPSGGVSYCRGVLRDRWRGDDDQSD